MPYKPLFILNFKYSSPCHVHDNEFRKHLSGGIFLI